MTAPGSPDGVDALADDLVEEYARLGWTIAVAESLTAGLVAARIASVPGASAVLRGGVVAYATDLKAELLGVDRDLLARVGAVDPDVARAMAEGVRMRLGATVGLATTGVAGPDPQDGHPPGVVWIGVATPSGSTVRGLDLAGGSGAGGSGRDLLADGDAVARRAAIRSATVSEVLSDALAVVDAAPPE